MEKIRILQRFFFLSLILILFLGCTKLLFENPIPKDGEIVQDLPEFFTGKYLKKGEQVYYDIQRINEKHCVIYSTYWIHKDSIHGVVEGLKNDSTSAEFRDNTIIIQGKDSTEKIKLWLDEDIYYTTKEPVYEINLDEGYFIDDFDKKFKKRVQLKSYKNKYFLNIIDDQGKWLSAWLENRNDSLIIRNSVIADTSFVDRLPYFNGLTKIEKIEEKTYLANPTDTELVKLLEEPDLFSEEIWIRVDDREKLNWIWQIVGISLLLIFGVFIAWSIKSKREDLNYKKIFLRTFIAALCVSALIGIIIFLVGDFGDTEIKVLGTTLAIGGYSLTGLGCSTIHDRKEFRPFSVIGMLFSVLGFLFTVSAIWSLFDSDHKWVAQAVFIFVILSISTAHISLLLQMKAKTKNIKYSLMATIIFISIVALMLIKATINDFEDSDFFFRLLGVFAILDVLGTIATPILNKITDKKE